MFVLKVPTLRASAQRELEPATIVTENV
jgi:hypothetical protein